MSKKYSRKGPWRFIIIATLAAVAFLFVKKNNLIRWMEAGITLSRQERTISEYEKENAEMKKQVELMSSDRDTLEKFARENFGYCEAGEDVYLVK